LTISLVLHPRRTLSGSVAGKLPLFAKGKRMSKFFPRRLPRTARVSLGLVVAIVPYLLPSGNSAGKTSATEPEGPAAAAAHVPTLASPVPYQVVQREGFSPARAHANQPQGPELGFADVAIVGQFPPESKLFEYRLSKLEGAFGRDVDWQEFAGRLDEGVFRGTARLPAGGWYRLEVRARKEQSVLATASVEPVGVGELFVIAGQSYASNANDERLMVLDPTARVVAFDLASQWRIAHDPQPTPDGSDGGSIWPAFGDALLPGLRVPVGFVNVAVGATSSEQWLPGTPLFDRLRSVIRHVGRFRAVLWQQGESDVIAGTTADQYVAHLTRIRESAAQVWGFEPPWLLAKSTLHPTVYNKPEAEGRIRAAIDELCRRPGFRHGPDTDILGGSYRGGPASRRHFTGEGQRAAALLWFAAVWTTLQQQPQSEHPLRRVLYNFDGDSCLHTKAGTKGPAAVSVDDVKRLIEKVADEGSQVDTVLVCINAQVMYYPTRVGTLRGTLSSDEERANWPESEKQRFRNMQAFFEAGVDPYAIMLAETKRRGREALLTFRMNDDHGNDFLRTQFLVDHPEWRLGTEQYRGKGAMDFGREEVRDYTFRLMEEAVRRYDSDGLELDFNRFPTFFKDGATAERVTKMNSLVERVRHLLDEVGQERGRRLVLAVRVPSNYGRTPPTPETALQLGCDVPAWARNGWIDFVTVSEFLHERGDLPIDLWKQALTMVPVYGGIECAKVGAPKNLTAAEYRQAAAKLLEAGADGIYLFNFFTSREAGANAYDPPFEVLRDLARGPL